MFESVRGREEGKLRFSKSPHPNLACQLLYSYIKERIKLRREGGRRRKGKKKKGKRSGSWVEGRERECGEEENTREWEIR